MPYRDGGFTGTDNNDVDGLKRREVVAVHQVLQSFPYVA